MDGVDLGRALVMIIFSCVNLVLCWVNYLDLRSPAYRSGLVVGPPTDTTLLALFVLNIIGSVCCAIEVINALSVPLGGKGGIPRLPLELEQCLVLAVQNIPVAAVNLSIVVCRMRHHTPLQVACCVFLVLDTLVRLIYAGTFHEEYKACSRAFMMSVKILVGLLFVLLLILAGLVWGRVNASFKPLPEPSATWLRGVSIMLLKAPHLERQRLQDQDISALVRQQAAQINMPWLVKDLWDIRKQEPLFNANYRCHTKGDSLQHPTVRPAECDGFDELRFRFRYNHKWEPTPSQPLGAISYNYAQIDVTADLCLPSNRTLSGDWRLFYFTVKLQGRVNWTVATLATSPWPEACTVPYPAYDPELSVCS